MINSDEVQFLIARLARSALASDNGVASGHRGDVDDVTRAHHEGAAKAYRRAIGHIVDYQTLSKIRALESEQCASRTSTSKCSDCVMFFKVSPPGESSSPDTESPTSGVELSCSSNTVMSPSDVRTA